MASPEDRIRELYLKERNYILETGHPLAPHFTDSWRDTTLNIFRLYRIQKDAADNWRRRRYSPNSTLVDSYDPRTGRIVRLRADEYNEMRRMRMVGDAEKKADILSGFAGNLLVRISPTPETRAITKAFLRDINTNNTITTNNTRP